MEARYLVKHKRRIDVYWDPCPVPATTTAFHFLLRKLLMAIRVKYSQLIHENGCCRGKDVLYKLKNFPPVQFCQLNHSLFDFGEEAMGICV